RRVFGNADARRADTAGRDHRARLIEQRQLAEFAELKHVVLENPVLLPRLQSGVLQVGRERLQQFGVADHVAANYFGGAGGDVLVAGDDRLARAALQRQDRDDTVRPERDDRRERQQQREPDGDATDRQRHQPLVSARDMVVITRLPLTQRQDGIAWFGHWDDESATHGACPFAPGEQDRGWILPERALNARHRGAVFLVADRSANAIEGLINGCRSF